MPRKKQAEDPRSPHEKQKEFLGHYGKTLSVTRAADLARIDRHEHYYWYGRDKRYAKAFDQAKEIAGHYLETECLERAAVGWDEDIYFQGAVCGQVRRFDSGLAQFLLRGLLPQKYGSSRTEISGPQGTPIQAKIEVVFVKPEGS
jgi:hypothetical protein